MDETLKVPIVHRCPICSANFYQILFKTDAVVHCFCLACEKTFTYEV